MNWTNFSHEFCQKRGQELLTPGMKGVLVTCNERERLCIREAYNVLNEVRFCSVNACKVSHWSQFLRPVIITYFFVNVKACSTYMLTQLWCSSNTTRAHVPGAKLQNTGSLIYIPLNHKSAYCFILCSSNDFDACKTDGLKWPCFW